MGLLVKGKVVLNQSLLPRSGWCLFNCLKFFKATHHMVWGLKSRLDEIGLLSTPNMYCGLVKGKVILHQALLSGRCG